jgi:lipopolysaccharide transport system ATP-binding protein
LHLLAFGGSKKHAEGLLMSSNDIAIDVRKLGKSYDIYRRPQDRLKQSVFPRLQQLVGRPPTRYYQEFWALRNISFEVKKGETVGIIGRNGSGKSTLLQLVCGTLSPSLGTVTTKGRIAALLELGSGFNPDFTGRENVYLNGAILGLTREEVDARFDDIANFADIGEFIEQEVKIYSSGMVVRLAFAVQAMVDPDILIVDEALAVGDEKFRRKCFARLEELKSKGTSILFVSHSGSQIVELCDRALLLENGERLLYGQPVRVVRAYQELIYAPVAEQKKLVKAYKAADQAGLDEPNIEQLSPVTFSENASEDLIDTKLVPESTQIYPVQGAEIRSLRILDREGRATNLLQPKQDYQFEVSGRFLEDIEQVYFGLHIRSISGAGLTGQRYPKDGKFVGQVKAGDDFRIIYGFKMVIMPGTYFVSAGVWSANEPNCRHRVVDALMFRILPDKNSVSMGYVDAATMEPILECHSPNGSGPEHL